MVMRNALSMGSIALLTSLYGCGEELEVTHTDLVGARAEITAFAFAMLGDPLVDSHDLVTASAGLGQLDVFSEEPGGYELFGSFTVSGTVLEILPASVGRETVLIVRTEGAVLLVSRDQVAYHTLAAPVALHAGRAFAMAAGDLTGDGSSELVLSVENGGVVVIYNLADAIRGHPEHMPELPRERLDTKPAGALAIADLNGDDRADVVAIGSYEVGTARVYLDPTVSGGPVGELALPSQGRFAVSTSCSSAPVQLVLSDGTTASLRAGSEPQLSASLDTSLTSFVAATDRIAAIDRELGVVLYDACRERLQPLAMAGTDAKRLTLSEIMPSGERRLGVLRRTGMAIDVYRLAGD